MPKVKSKAVAKTAFTTKSSSRTYTKAKPVVQAKGNTARYKTPKPVFFYDSWDASSSSEVGFLSPWWHSGFEVKGIVYESAAQFILAEKARAFGDEKIHEKILNAGATKHLKTLGEQISGVDETSWRRRVLRIAKTANLYKFTSDDAKSRELLKRLKSFKNRELVYADPSDNILGIGYSEEEAEEVGREKWGANVFGKSLDAVRDTVEAAKKPKKPKKRWESQMSREGHLVPPELW